MRFGLAPRDPMYEGGKYGVAFSTVSGRDASEESVPEATPLWG